MYSSLAQIKERVSPGLAQHKRGHNLSGRSEGNAYVGCRSFLFPGSLDLESVHVTQLATVGDSPQCSSPQLLDSIQSSPFIKDAAKSCHRASCPPSTMLHVHPHSVQRPTHPNLHVRYCLCHLSTLFSRPTYSCFSLSLSLSPRLVLKGYA